MRTATIHGQFFAIIRYIILVTLRHLFSNLVCNYSRLTSFTFIFVFWCFLHNIISVHFSLVLFPDKHISRRVLIIMVTICLHQWIICFASSLFKGCPWNCYCLFSPKWRSLSLSEQCCPLFQDLAPLSSFPRSNAPRVQWNFVITDVKGPTHFLRFLVDFCYCQFKT